MQTRSGFKSSSKNNTVEKNDDAPSRYPFKDAGVDWITVTCRAGETQHSFDELGYSLLHTEAELGAKLKPWRFENFEGLNAGHIAVGKLDDMTLIRMSASVAWAYWRKAFELSTNCSRIDLQFTLRDVTKPDDFILDKHKEALDHSNSLKRPTEVDLRLSNRRGPTLYLGVRESARFGRVYNKFRESKLDHYLNCVRLELQCNGKAALFAARAIDGSGNDPWAVIPFVAGFFQGRGILPSWPDTSVHNFTVPRSRGSAASRLAWLRSQVAPAIRALIEAGLFDATIEALGLPGCLSSDRQDHDTF